MSRKHPVLVAVTLALLSPAVWAWGEQGHQVIAALAESKLTPEVLQEVKHLLALEPGATLESISTWADEHRNPTTASWHYVNFPKNSCTYEAERDCPNGQCVVAAIDRQTEILASHAPDEKKLLALKYVVHFIGDVHQPLHAGYKEDRGGNTYQLQAFMRGSNLHALWDSGLLKALDQDNSTIVHSLQIRAMPQHAPYTAVSAAEDSCKIVGKLGFYPETRLNAAYVQTYTPVMLFQLAVAGDHLAQVLNSSLKPH